MLNTKKLTKSHKYIITTVVALIVVVVALLILNPANNTLPSSGQFPQNGSYRIAEAPNVQCTLSNPPTCSGTLILSDQEPTRLEAKIIPASDVSYQNKDIKIYAPELKEGMLTKVTFKPNSADIATIVIVD